MHNMKFSYHCRTFVLNLQNSMTQIQDLIYYKDFIDPVLKSWGQMLQKLQRNGFFQFSEV